MKVQMIDFTKVKTADDLAAILDAMQMKWNVAPVGIQYLVKDIEVDGRGNLLAGDQGKEKLTTEKTR